MTTRTTRSRIAASEVEKEEDTIPSPPTHSSPLGSIPSTARVSFRHQHYSVWAALCVTWIVFLGAASALYYFRAPVARVLFPNVADARIVQSRVDKLENVVGALIEDSRSTAQNTEIPPVATDSALDATDLSASASAPSPHSISHPAAVTVSDARVLELEQKLAALQSSQMRSQTHNQLSALLVNVMHVRDAIKQGHRFDLELMATRAFFPEDTTIQLYVEQLSPHAARGLPSLSSLTHQFLEMADTLVMVDRAAHASNGWRDQFFLTLSHIIRVRKIAAATNETSAEAIVARAESLLKDGNLSAALSELKSLEGQAATTLSPWMEDAEAVRVADDTAERLFAYVTHKMVQESGVVPAL